MKQLINIAILVLFCVGMLFSQDTDRLGIDNTDIPEGLEVGVTAPEFTGKDQNGDVVSLNAMLGDGPVILIFYRGFWCSKCSHYLSAYADSLSLLTDKGAQVIAVTPENLSGIEQTIEKTGFNACILADKGSRIMRDYDVGFKVTEDYSAKINNYYKVDIAENNDSDVAELPVPATYIIQRKESTGQALITWRHFDLNYGKRASVKAILEHL